MVCVLIKPLIIVVKRAEWLYSFFSKSNCTECLDKLMLLCCGAYFWF